MSELGYGIAVELLRQGEKGDGIWLDWINCRELLFEIEEGQNDTATLSELAEMNKSTINRLKNRIRTFEVDVIGMGKELDRLGKVEELCRLYEMKLEKWGCDINELAEEYGLQDNQDALHKVGGWEDE